MLDERTSELCAVNGLATGSVPGGEISTLKHEVGDDTMERGSGVTKSILASAQLTEIPCSFGDDVIIESEYDPTSSLAVDGDIKLFIGPVVSEEWLKKSVRLTNTSDMVGGGKDVMVKEGLAISYLNGSSGIPATRSDVISRISDVWYPKKLLCLIF
jgi:hypothetical protein